MKSKLIIATLPSPKDELISTARGRVTYLNWCKSEATRIGNGARVGFKGNKCWVERP